MERSEIEIGGFGGEEEAPSHGGLGGLGFRMTYFYRILFDGQFNNSAPKYKQCRSVVTVRSLIKSFDDDYTQQKKKKKKKVIR